MLSQINVLPGLMRQTALLNFKVMQGEFNRVTLLLHGAGEVTRVQPDNLVLAWNVEPVENSKDRRLVIQLNQPQKDQFSILVQAQTPLEAFPLTVDALQMRPENATRFAGYFRIVNEGAVRLEVAQARGATQISPGAVSRKRLDAGGVSRGGEPAVCLSVCRRGRLAADSGGPDSAGAGGFRTAGLSRRGKRACQEGTFREDLYYRLNVIRIVIPPLRERKNEILPLAETLLSRHLPKGQKIPVISEELKRFLLDYRWPGNVRELENVMRRFIVYQNSDNCPDSGTAGRSG